MFDTAHQQRMESWMARVREEQSAQERAIVGLAGKVSLVKAGMVWHLAERRKAQAKRDEQDWYDRGVRLMWGNPIVTWKG